MITEYETRLTKDLIPYARNAKKHDKKQIDNVAQSISEFGMVQPIVVDRDNNVIIGHCRLLACKKLKIKKVPVVKLDDLTPEEANKLRLLDNKLNESSWDFDLLAEDIPEIDFTGYDVDWSLPEIKEDDDRDPSCQHNVFENQERMQVNTNNYYGIPNMAPTTTFGSEFLRFMDYNIIDNHGDYIAHFYYDDYKFIEAWRNPDKYIPKLQKFKAVISPDFSLYTDFPRALQILSCYRRQWVGAYWQSQGLDVIPDVVWGDRESFSYCFDGIPDHSVVAVSSVGVKNDKNWNGENAEMFKAGYDEMLNRLKPKKVLYYGDMIDGLDGDIIQIPSYYAEKREYLNQKAKEKKENGAR